MLNLEFDKQRPYHYLVGIGVHPARDERAGQFFMKYLVRFTNDEIVCVRDAIRISKNKLFPTTINEAMQVTECSHLVHGVSAMLLSANFNNVTIHHFSSDTEWSDDDLEMFVKMANSSESIKKQLLDARIRG